MGAVRQNPIQRTVRTANLSVLMTVHNFSSQYTMQHRTVVMEESLTLRLHMIMTMMKLTCMWYSMSRRSCSISLRYVTLTPSRDHAMLSRDSVITWPCHVSINTWKQTETRGMNNGWDDMCSPLFNEPVTASSCTQFNSFALSLTYLLQIYCNFLAY